MSTVHAQKAQKTHKIQKGATKGDKAESSQKAVSAEVGAVGHSGEDASNVSSQQPTQQQQYWEATTAGQAWFDLCSALPGLQYLSAVQTSSSVEEMPYELRPSMDNVCAALSVLLGLRRQGSGTVSNDTASAESQRPWSLKDIEVSWNDVVRTQQQLDVGSAREIAVTQGVVRFRAPFSDTEMITREVGSISFVGGRQSIDIELEGAHQLAMVKHRLGRGSVDQGVWTAKMVEAIRQSYEQRVRSVVLASPDATVPVPGDTYVIQQALESAVLGDRKLTTLATVLSAYPQCLKSSQLDGLIVDALLTSRWGEERRTGADFGNTGAGSADGGTVLSVTDASLTSADAKTQALESVQMTLQALAVIAHCSDAQQTAQLVRWMLQEAPSDVTPLQLAPALLRIDPAVRGQSAFQHELKELFATTATGTAKVLGKALLFDTPQCPSKSFFALLGRGGDQGQWTLKEMWWLLRAYAQYSFTGGSR